MESEGAEKPDVFCYSMGRNKHWDVVTCSVPSRSIVIRKEVYDEYKMITNAMESLESPVGGKLVGDIQACNTTFVCAGKTSMNIHDPTRKAQVDTA